MASEFKDARGYIQDLLIHPLDGVTRIFTRAGAVRGNHTHKKTTQWTYVVSGWIQFAWTDADGVFQTAMRGEGALVEEPPGIPHAWKAVEDTVVLVFTAGPRTGEGYESDTVRLEVPLLV